MKNKNLLLLGLTIATIDIAIPYLFLKNTTKYWINYLFWTIFTIIVLTAGIWKIKKWGE